MNEQIKESDWKIIRDLRVIAVERAFDQSTQEMQRLLDQKDQTGRKRFWAVLEFAKKRHKEIANAFDDLSRSSAMLKLLSMCSLGVVNEEELSRLSPAAKEWLQNTRRPYNP